MTVSKRQRLWAGATAAVVGEVAAVVGMLSAVTGTAFMWLLVVVGVLIATWGVVFIWNPSQQFAEYLARAQALPRPLVLTGTVGSSVANAQTIATLREWFVDSDGQVVNESDTTISARFGSSLAIRALTPVTGLDGYPLVFVLDAEVDSTNVAIAMTAIEDQGWLRVPVPDHAYLRRLDRIINDLEAHFAST